MDVAEDKCQSKIGVVLLLLLGADILNDGGCYDRLPGVGNASIE